MATTITMPKLGLTMNSGSVQQWKKKIGDPVKKGELLYVVATDKLTVDVESPADGVLLAITVKEGQDVPVGAPIGAIGAAGEKADVQAAPVAATAAPAAATPAAQAPAQQGARTKSGVIASPKAKKLARDNGVDLSAIRGTGPNGWIIARDVAAAGKSAVKTSPVAAKMAAESGVDLQALDTGKRIMKADVAAAMAAGPDGRRMPVTQMRRIIGERMLLSVSTIPAVSYFTDVNMSALNELRASYNARLEKKASAEGKNLKISVNDILMKLCAKLLLENPMANASVEVDATGKSTAFVLHDSVNIGFAVALKDGLLVPNVKDIQIKSLTQIAGERAELVDRARSGGLTPDQMTGGTFTISNLGMMGIDSFTPIINPPEAAILGVGTTSDRPVVRDGSVVVRPIATFCLTADHRLVDGADGAAFLNRLKELIENPDLFLL